ncbi:TPA: hypothetical protein I7280_24380 [Vibrio parahaemolyticus]|nr:hypothetical protein [Vibrio parahaemolyticus]
MSNEWRKAAKSLTDEERIQALEHQLENMDGAEAGIIRQLLGDEQKPLSEKQQYIYHHNIEETLVEKCGRSGCNEFVVAGVGYCPSCEIEFGG